jgi:hypothetical protein
MNNGNLVNIKLSKPAHVIFLLRVVSYFPSGQKHLLAIGGLVAENYVEHLQVPSAAQLMQLSWQRS